MRMADGSVYRWELSQQQQRYRLQGEPRMAASDMSARTNSLSARSAGGTSRCPG
jgi:hypothetical protein